MNKIWKTQTESHALISMLITTLGHAGCDHYNWFFISLVVTHFSMSLVWKIEKHRKNLYFLSIVLSLCRQSHTYPMFALLTLAYEQRRLTHKTAHLMRLLHNTITDLLGVMPGTTHPMFGANDSTIIARLRDLYVTVRDHVASEFGEYLMVERKTEAIWLRDHGVSSIPLRISDRPTVAACDMRSTIETTQKMYRTALVLVIFLLGIMVLRLPLLVLVGILVYLYTTLENEVRKLDYTSKGAPLKEGVYLIRNDIFGINFSHGIGVVFNGVMHIPYHVCSARQLHIGKTIYKPYYISTSTDMVTYNGPSQVLSPTDDEQIYVNCETFETRTSYLVTVDIDMSANMITWQGVTRPGESGSPVYGFKSGKIVLLGLAGRYYKNSDGIVTEYTDSPTAVTPIADSPYQKHIFHPGYGKTMKVVPSIIVKHLVAEPQGKVIVAGPTRVVCKELYKSLKDQFKTSLIVKDHPSLRDNSAQVQIGAHATIIRLIENGDPAVRAPTCLIIDEAHFGDASTIMLRHYGQWMVGMGYELHELSATLDGEYATGSNYPIVEQTISLSSVASTAEEELSLGRRVLIFVPSLKTTTELQGQLMKHNPILLSRESYTNVHPYLNDTNRRLIFSTEIAECGVNISDLDTVIDIGTKFTYLYDNKVVYGRTIPITMGSYVQRKGRVGRTKEGRYYGVGKPQEMKIETASLLDAQIMMTGRAWSPGITNPLNICLSGNQLTMMYEKQEIPTQVYLTRRVNGEPKSAQERAQILTEMRTNCDMVHYVGCRKEQCTCKGNWAWFDERIHDELIGNRIPMTFVEI
ncbi:NSP2 [Inopus flavus jingmenvirus 1]|nr:NSP2 [Inopus flavus jingmenvirus 1]